MCYTIIANLYEILKLECIDIKVHVLYAAKNGIESILIDLEDLIKDVKKKQDEN